MKTINSLTDVLEQEPIDLDDRCNIMTEKKRKLLNALTILKEIVEQQQTEADSEKHDFFQEYDYFYYQVQKGLWHEISDPLETHILTHFISSYIDYM
ncbi:hypothetical protein [uncultured Shewanella sp.]|uniref:hypothetical protein n=1 Tax=uncultured Shewanella sp. TaxID=173975 RepID=UPI002603F8DE|nr:hypothetical protein [uncultured Shewanella sp.]